MKEKYYNRIINPPRNNSFFLFGPRGVGKTSWLKRNYPSALYFDLLDSAVFRKFITRPEDLERSIPENFSEWIVLDEIQKVPELLNEVHRLIENKKYKFILTGSSARKLRRKGVNLLAGRAYTYRMYPLTIEELGADFSLAKSFKVGHLPKAYTVADFEDFINSYIDTYLKEEVKQEGLIRNLGDFYRFLEVASFSQGEILNIAEVARESDLTRDKAESFFNILEDLLIAIRIPVFHRRAKRVLLKRSKFYYFDVGVFRALRPLGPLDSEQEIDGPALETLFLQEALALNDYYKYGYDFYYWRTKTGLEVDFIMYGKKGLKAVEIKRKRKITEKDLRGIKAFKKDYPEADCYVLANVFQPQYYENIKILPIEKTLRNLKGLLS